MSREFPALPLIATALPMAVLAMLAPRAGRADFFHHWENQEVSAGRITLNPEAKIYGSVENFGPDGSPVAPGQLTSYDRLQTDILLRYGMSQNWTIYGRFSFARVAVEHPTLGAEGFGLADQTAGLNWRALSLGARSWISLQFEALLPAYNNEAAEDEGVPFLGDGSIDLTGGMFVTIPLDSKDVPQWTARAGAGFTFRSNGFSQAIPWSVAAVFDPIQQGFRGGVGVFGIFSLESDATNPSQAGLTAGGGPAAGGSFAVNAVNPALVTGRAQAGYRFSDRFAFQGGVNIAMAGSTAPSGASVDLGLQFNWGPRGGSSNPRDLTPEQYGRSNQGFVPYAFEAHISRTNDRLNLFKIDKGRMQGVESGQVFDIFSVGKDGIIGEAVARAKATSVKPDETVIKIVEYYKEVWIEEGFIVKRPLNGNE
ncbi:MAG: hypothetical protein IT285_10535 [Bdellovibrionales bacterium]|nr:hypothetical protein [Bdellovibrionales bacterium]